MDSLTETILFLISLLLILCIVFAISYFKAANRLEKLQHSILNIEKDMYFLSGVDVSFETFKYILSRLKDNYYTPIDEFRAKVRSVEHSQNSKRIAENISLKNEIDRLRATREVHYIIDAFLANDTDYMLHAWCSQEDTSMINQKDYHTKPASPEKAKNAKQAAALKAVVNHNRPCPCGSNLKAKDCCAKR